MGPGRGACAVPTPLVSTKTKLRVDDPDRAVGRGRGNWTGSKFSVAGRGRHRLRPQAGDWVGSRGYYSDAIDDRTPASDVVMFNNLSRGMLMNIHSNLLV